MVHGGPAFLFVVEVEHRELDDPGEVHRLRVVKLQLRAESLPQRVQRLAGDFQRVGHEQQQIARRGLQALRDFREQLGLEVLGDGRGSVPSSSTLNQARPFAPNGLTNSVRSSMPFRE